MSLKLPDRDQIDPKSVWLVCDDTDMDRGPDFYLAERDSGSTVAQEVNSFCGMLPRPFGRRWCQHHDEWRFQIPMSLSKADAIEVARGYGFRTGPEDVSHNGDPGYLPGIESREKVFSARRREGRPEEDPVTVIFALEAKQNSNGFVAYDSLPPEDIPWAPQLFIDHSDDFFLTDALPAEVSEAWKAQGFVERDDVVASFYPSELYFALVVDGEEDEGRYDDDDLVAVFMTIKDHWGDDELRDHSLTVMPACLGENQAEGMWSLRRGVSREQARTELLVAGFVAMPEDMKKQIW